MKKVIALSAVLSVVMMLATVALGVNPNAPADPAWSLAQDVLTALAIPATVSSSSTVEIGQPPGDENVVATGATPILGVKDNLVALAGTEKLERFEAGATNPATSSTVHFSTQSHGSEHWIPAEANTLEAGATNPGVVQGV